MSDKIEEAIDRDVRPFLAEMPLTMEGHEILSFRDAPSDCQRYEAILKSVFVQYCKSRGEIPAGGVKVQMTYDPVSNPNRPICGPTFRESPQDRVGRGGASSMPPQQR